MAAVLMMANVPCAQHEPNIPLPNLFLMLGSIYPMTHCNLCHRRHRRQRVDR
jgi:hypothetical protein